MKVFGIAGTALLAAGLGLPALSTPALAQDEDLGQQAVEFFGSAKSYAASAWQSLFPEQVKICIGYGTEKETWLKQEVEKFSHERSNRNLTIQLVPLGSLAGVAAVEQNGGRISGGGASCVMTAWSPASGAYRDYVTQRTFRSMTTHGVQAPGIAAPADLIAAQAPSLVRIPLVFVMWPDVYQRVVDAAHKADPGAADTTIFTFDGLIKAEQAASTDGAYTTFYTTNPGESNSGFSSLLLMGYEFTKAGRGGLDPNAVAPRNDAFWSHVKLLYASNDGKSLNNFSSPSTGTLFRDQFLTGGPQSDISGVVTYENLAIQYADIAKKSQNASYRVVYPARNVMSDNPYYVFNATYDMQSNQVALVPEKEKKAAIAFMQFLIEPEQQRDAVELGFRPGNLQAGIDINDPSTPFVRMKDIGVQAVPPGVHFMSVSKIPEAVIANLLTGWSAVEGTLK